MIDWQYRGVTIQLVDDDIALQDTEAVTTAAHWRLNGGTGTDGTIHSKGGPDILKECQKIGGCPIGDAVVTGAGNLPAEFVIHAVGPVWNTEKDERQTKILLESAYLSTMKRAAEIEVKSVSIPVISTGAFAVPFSWAVPIAVATVFGFLDREESSLKTVRHVVYSREDETVEEMFKVEIEDWLSRRLSGEDSK